MGFDYLDSIYILKIEVKYGKMLSLGVYNLIYIILYFYISEKYTTNKISVWAHAQTLNHPTSLYLSLLQNFLVNISFIPSFNKCLFQLEVNRFFLLICTLKSKTPFVFLFSVPKEMRRVVGLVKSDEFEAPAH